MSEKLTECLMVREEFSALLDGELPAAERERVEDHLADCAECLRALNRFKRVDDAYAGLAAVAAPEGFEAAIHEALHPTRVRPFPFKPVIGTLVAAAAAVLLVIGVWPRTAVAPGDGAYQLSKSVEDAPSESSEEVEQAPAELQRSLVVEAEADRFDAGADVAGSAVSDDVVIHEDLDAVRQNSAGSAFEAFRDERSEMSEPLTEAPAAPSPVAGSPTASAPSAPTLDESMETDRNLEMRRRETSSVGQRAAAAPKALEKKEMEEAPVVGESNEAGPQPELSRVSNEAIVPAPRTFEVRDGVWYETGYADQEVQSVERGSALLEELIAADPTVAELVENDSRIVFAVDGAWYALDAAS